MITLVWLSFLCGVCQWNQAAADCRREPPCVLSTATTMETVQENRSAARPRAATTAAIPADRTAATSFFYRFLQRRKSSLSLIKYIALVCTKCDTFWQNVESPPF